MIKPTPSISTPASTSIMTREKLAVLHVAKKQLCLSDEDYRNLLSSIGGVASAKELNQHGFEAVMYRLTGLGFQSDWSKKNLGYRTGMATPRQIAMIRELWQKFTANKGDDASLGKWIEGKFHVSAVRFLDSQTAHKACGALKRMTGNPAAKVHQGRKEKAK
jgi:hypothetical protein